MSRKSMIVDALGEVREHLILNKYNEAMMLMAQITIDTVAHLVDEALIVSKNYEEDIKTLKTVGVLSEDTAHNFETLIMSGIQAHNGVDIPKEHAETALQVLTNELDLIFEKENKETEAESANDGSKVFEYDEESPYEGDFSRDMTSSGETPAFMASGDDSDFRRKERIREEMLAQESRKGKRNVRKLIAIIIPILFVLLIVFVVKGIFFSGPKPEKIKIEETTVIETFEPETEETSETLPPLPAEAGYYDVTGDLVKVRDGASTEGTKVIGLVNKGDKIQVKSFYNTDWAVVVYEGKEAFVSRRYIKKDESLSPVFEEGATVVEEETRNEE